jgi:kynureninase
MAAHKASLDLFTEVGMKKLRNKSILLTQYMEFLIHYINENYNSKLEIITPKNINERGCQLSIIAHGFGKELFEKLSENHIIVDWREPNVIRAAPVPFYNSFEDVFKFGEVLKNILNEH